MKQFFFLIAITALGSTAAIAAPFWGVMLYYGFATLRPQYLWEWAMVDTPNIRWSLTVAFVAVVATFIHLPSLLSTIKLNKVMGLVGIYAVLMLMSMLTAFNTRVAGYWAEEYGKVFLMMFIATLVIQRLWQVRAMALLITLCLGYIAYEVNYLYLVNGGRLDIYHKGYGGLDNNGAGSMLALGIPFAYWAAMSRDGQWKTPRRLFGVFAGLALMHAVLMTYSRGAMLAALVGLLWLAVQHRPRFQAGLLIAGVVLCVSVMAGPEIRDRFQSTAEYKQDESAQLRFESWASAWDMAWTSPLLGKGIRNSNAYSQNFGSDRAGRTIHNQYLQVAADSGIPAATCYIAMLVIGGLGLGRARRACMAKAIELNEDECDQDLIDRVEGTGTLCLAIQTSLIIFSVSGVFLSVELVEVPWLLITLSGIAPVAVYGFLGRIKENHLHDDEEDDDAEPHQMTPPPTPKAKAA